jgi:hypothetical protein
VNFYLQKYGFCTPQIDQPPHDDVGIIVVIPCFNEPDLCRSLQSLRDCTPTKSKVEVIIVVNSGEHHPAEVKRQNLKSIEEFHQWNEVLEWIQFHIIHKNDLPKKHAGVGLARKIGMDEAVARFHQLKRDGVIVCFDADSECDQNYLVEIEKHFERHPKTPGCSIHFEHPLNGHEFSSEIYEGIINYELHLRYYKRCLQWCDLPYAFHTVGSSMAVRSSVYQKQGGMNKRKAGEDFYFIHKIIALGNFTELNTSRVIPSPRTSDRVPFGTGKAIADWMDSEKDHLESYAFESFKEIKTFVSQLPVFYQGIQSLDEVKVSDAFKDWLKSNDFIIALENIRSNTTDLNSFKKRFFVWFNAFAVLKLVHHLRDSSFPNQNINTCCQNFLKKENTNLKFLQLLREQDNLA